MTGWLVDSARVHPCHVVRSLAIIDDIIDISNITKYLSYDI